MAKDEPATIGRRDVLKQIAGAPLMPALVGGAAVISPARADDAPRPAQTPAAANAPAPPDGYQSLSPDEAAFVEAMVNVMCPADSLTPNGVDCGLATFIDRQLAAGFGHGENLYMLGPWKKASPQFGYQLPLTPELYFKAGIAAANASCTAQHGATFDAMAPADQEAFLQALTKNKIKDRRVNLGEWFNELVYPLFVQACFADPLYGGNRNKVFWRLVGYPGLPATHTRDVVDFRGKPYPGAKDPKSILDFS